MLWQKQINEILKENDEDDWYSYQDKLWREYIAEHPEEYEFIPLSSEEVLISRGWYKR